MSTDTDTTPPPDDRARRAAAEAMVVVDAGPALFEVYSGETSVHVVDLAAPACTCRDFQYRWRDIDRRCKHHLRVRQTLGVEPVPEGVRPDPVLLRQREAFSAE